MVKKWIIILQVLGILMEVSAKKDLNWLVLESECIIMDTVCKGELREYRIIKEEGSIYSWWIDGILSQETSEMITVQWKDPGIHWLEVQQFTESGCYGEIATSEVYVVDCPPATTQPTAFTPDGDGLNDLFTPLLKQDKGMPVTYELKIFNKRGLILFETTTPGEGWDGRYKGILLQTDSYYYQLKIKYPGSEKSEKRIGIITLINRN